jgi:glyceraldehyde 3-phosphate dehydrogenase
MKKRVAINGFGRIGRSVARIILQSYSDELELVAINDPSSGQDSAILFEFDSNFGRFPGGVVFHEDSQEFEAAGRRIKKLTTRNIEELPWGELGIDVVLESTGVFKTQEDCMKHVHQGARKVLLSCPPKGDGFNVIVVGVNDENLHPDNLLVSNASCTTNCLAPVAKFLDQAFGIESGFMTTVHSYTTSQKILDMADKKRFTSGTCSGCEYYSNDHRCREGDWKSVATSQWSIGWNVDSSPFTNGFFG